jgi:hypothetical protein
MMPNAEIRLWPGVPDLRALGARSFEDLMGPGGELEGEAQSTVKTEKEGYLVLRYPLPGTVHAPGEKPSRPRGAGTGYVDLQRWTGGGVGARISARMRAPRSASFAARAWNLICHLREAGVGTAEPLAMGQEESPLFASRSFLVTRALDPMQTLPDYLADNDEALDRNCVCQSLGLLLRRVQDAGVELAQLAPTTLFVARLSSKQDKASCAISKINSTIQSSPVPGMHSRPLPELALADVNGARIHAQLTLQDRAAQLAALADSSDVSQVLRPRDLLRIAHHALGRSFDRAARRQALRKIIQSHRS